MQIELSEALSYSITSWLVYVIVWWPDQGPSTQNSLWNIIRLSQSPSLLISEDIKNLPLALRARKKIELDL